MREAVDEFEKQVDRNISRIQRRLKKGEFQ
jgi:hypothetical protein